MINRYCVRLRLIIYYKKSEMLHPPESDPGGRDGEFTMLISQTGDCGNQNL